MEKKIALVDFRAENLLFSVNKTFTPTDEQLALDMKVGSQFRMGENSGDPTFMNVVLRLFENAAEKNYPFSITVDMTGVFVVEAETAEEREALIKEQGLVYLLPYARSLVSQIAAMANMPTAVILPPMDMNTLKTAE